MCMTVALVAGILVCFVLLLIFQITMPNADDALEFIRNVAKDPDRHVNQVGSSGRDAKNLGGVINN